MTIFTTTALVSSSADTFAFLWPFVRSVAVTLVLVGGSVLGFWASWKIVRRAWQSGGSP